MGLPRCVQAVPKAWRSSRLDVQAGLKLGTPIQPTVQVTHTLITHPHYLGVQANRANQVCVFQANERTCPTCGLYPPTHPPTHPPTYSSIHLFSPPTHPPTLLPTDSDAHKAKWTSLFSPSCSPDSTPQSDEDLFNCETAGPSSISSSSSFATALSSLPFSPPLGPSVSVDGEEPLKEEVRLSHPPTHLPSPNPQQLIPTASFFSFSPTHPTPKTDGCLGVGEVGGWDEERCTDCERNGEEAEGVGWGEGFYDVGGVGDEG